MGIVSDFDGVTVLDTAILILIAVIFKEHVQEKALGLSCKCF